MSHCKTSLPGGRGSVSRWHQRKVFGCFAAVKYILLKKKQHFTCTKHTWMKMLCTECSWSEQLIIICPTAIAYSMGQIIKSVCICQRICLSVCEHSRGHISWLIFAKIGTDVRTPKGRTSSLGVNIAPFLPLFCPTKPPFSAIAVWTVHSWRSVVSKVADHSTPADQLQQSFCR